MTPFCISKQNTGVTTPVTGRDTGRRKVTFWGHFFDFVTGCHDPLGGGRDGKTAFLQSNFGAVTGVTT